jgi:excisionase family DNA binding protein
MAAEMLSTTMEIFVLEHKPRTMTIAKTCETYGVSKSTIYNLLNAGKIEMRKIGRRSLIVTASMDALLNLESA